MSETESELAPTTIDELHQSAVYLPGFRQIDELPQTGD